MDTDRDELTSILRQAADGDRAASERLFNVIYPTLRKLARSQLNQHRRETLYTTDLVHEAYLRLLGTDKLGDLSGRGHLFAAVARVMRHILVDRARRRGADKRGGDLIRVPLEDNQQTQAAMSSQVLALDTALRQLQQIDQRGHDVVEMRFFGGCSLAEIAAHLNVSDTTVKRDWRRARAYLHANLGGSPGS